METGLTTIPANHQLAIQQMHTHAAGLMKAKYENPRISQLTPEVVVAQVRESIQDCFKSLGHWDNSKDNEVLEYQTKEMIRYFISEFKNLTIQEFKIILRNMVKGDYKAKKEDNTTCSVQSMCHAIKGYLASEEYKMAFTDYHARLSLPAKKVEPPPEEVEKMLKNACNRAYEDFKADGTLPYACGVIYDYFKKHKGIVWTKEQREQIEKEADLAYKQKLKGTRDEPTKDGLKAEKKRVALKHYFNSLIKK